MKKRYFLALSAALCLMVAVVSVQAQTTATTTPSQAESSDETNLDTQLYLIVATNQDVDDSKMPSSLDGIVRQLRATLPFKSYRLAATLINRVKNEGSLQLNWIGGPLASPSSAASTGNPSFSHFNVRQVRLVRSADGHQTVQMQGFNFGARIPVQISQALASSGAGLPTMNYENTGLRTDISLREAEPVIVGTLNVGPSGDAIILVVSAKRTQK
jgi:hypothetical protein